MKAILAVLLFVGLAAAALPPRGAVSGILKDLQQKISQDVKQVVDHAKEDYENAMKHVKEAGQAASSKPPREALHLIKENLKQSAQKIAADGKTDTQAVVGHLKEAYGAIKAALKQPKGQ